MVAGLDGTVSLFAGAVALGVVHGAEPGHGWPVAAAYALDHERRWFHGFAASFLLGVGHLVSSVAVVAVFFLAKDYFGLTQLGWIRYVAGVLLIGLGIREYRHGHSHGHGEDGHSHADHDHSYADDHGHSHDHPHADDHGHSHTGVHSDDEAGHSHDHDESAGDSRHGHDGRDAADDGPGAWAQFAAALPLVGDGTGGHTHLSAEDVDRQGLAGIVGTAFVLGFAHEEEFEIIGLCLGSSYCLELMLVYALAVLGALVALTMALLAGFERYGERVERYADHLPTVSAVVLVALGVGFIFGVV